ncbi:ROK family protein [Salinicola peritrichatus]|uniref:ROK family protein n=1 Tax=Salinicola peritrichatus TaxID=1267424 RepID=UPI0013A64FEE|nr:ROK family protein [Salinicola peritrichatus]
MEHVFGIDIGGSAIKLGIVDDSGHVVAKDTFPLSDIDTLDELVFGTAKRLTCLANIHRLSPVAIGISAPGHCDRLTGEAIDGTGNVPPLKRGSFPVRLSIATGLPSTIDNDGVCATRGELEYGAGRHANSFALITIGTGIGGALVIDRHIAIGANAKPPEFGAMVLEPGHSSIRHGLRGTLEDLASGKAIISAYAHRTGEQVQSLDVDTIRRRALQGDRHALAAFDTMARYVAQAFGTMINLTAIDLCLVGGGVSLAGDFLLDRIRRNLPNHAWPYLVQDVTIAPTAHGNDSGLIGAAVTIRQRLGRTNDGEDGIFHPTGHSESGGR